MNSKPKSIDMGSLIQKVTKRARELLKKKSKPQTKGKSANGTSRYSKSKRQKLLIGGVRVKLGDGEKQKILNIIGVRTQEANKEQAQAHLVELLKLKTIEKINKKLVDYTTNISNDSSKEGKFNETDAEEIKKIEKILNDVGIALKLSTTEDFETFKTRQTELATIYKESSDKLNFSLNIGSVVALENKIYEYQLFTGDIESYKLCNIEKEITTLNIFKLFYDLTKMKEDPTNVLSISGGAFNDVYLVENGLEVAKNGDFAATRLKVYESLLSEVKTTIKDIRKEFQSVDLVKALVKTGISRVNARSSSNPANSSVDIDEDEDLVGEAEFTDLSPENRLVFNNILNEVRRGGIIKTLEYTENEKTFRWGISNGDNNKRFILYTFDNHRAKLNEQLRQAAIDNNVDSKQGLLSSNTYGKLTAAITSLNEKIKKLEEEYAKDTLNIKKINTLIEDIRKDKEAVIKSHNDFVGKNKHAKLRPDSLSPPNIFSSPGLSLEADIPGQDPDLLIQRTAKIQRNALEKAESDRADENKGGNPVKYKSTGQVVHIMFQNKKYKRVIYVKDKRNTKYCKMNNEYILLSKLKVIE